MHPKAHLGRVDDTIATRKKREAKSVKTDLMDEKVMQFLLPPSYPSDNILKNIRIDEITAKRNRLAVERAVREAHELALAEAREGVALERINEEFRQRMMDDALENVAKASIGTQSTSERTSARSNHRAKCAAVDRQRALKKAVSQKTADQLAENLDVVQRWSNMKERNWHLLVATLQHVCIPT
ncbi:hypothetical protein Tco_1579645 [Tanacetum coccineum]